MTRKGRAITLSVDDHQKAQLEAIALEFNITWGDKPNISQLVKTIADGKLRVAANHDWTGDRINILNQARNLLIDAGEIDSAVAIAQLLLERGELSIPLRQELEQFVHQPVSPWRLEVERLIRRQQPFQLAYQDAAGHILNFTVRYAEIVRHEERQYLDCWCDETEGNRDIPELIHNWCLRLDRLANDAAISPMAGRWRPAGLDQVPVEMHLTGGLAFAYRTKSGADVVNEWHPERPQVRRVVRQITSTFWFFREVLRYGEECEVVSPAGVRSLMKHKADALSALYQDEP
ncbi:MAG: helix-turn-helix transcriptional regulator [Elainellaceae cyanobacterium]